MNPLQVAIAILAGLGAGAPAQTIAALRAWFAAEGGAGPQWGIAGNVAAYNPLNTTLDLPGSAPTPGNVPPVRAYASWSQGIIATVATLKQANMAGIAAVLRSGGDCHALSAAVAASPWGTGAFGCPDVPAPSSPAPNSPTGTPTQTPVISQFLPFFEEDTPMTLDQMHTFVRWAYQTFLGRQPESPAAMGAWVTVCNTQGTEAVVAGLIGSPEGQRFQAAQRKLLGV